MNDHLDQDIDYYFDFNNLLICNKQLRRIKKLNSLYKEVLDFNNYIDKYSKQQQLDHVRKNLTHAIDLWKNAFENISSEKAIAEAKSDANEIMFLIEDINNLPESSEDDKEDNEKPENIRFA